MKSFVIACSLCLCISIVSYGQTLHNGIKLPSPWPPRYSSPTKASPMPLPYIKNKPKVIPINVGRQLFVDDFLISSTNLKPIYHNAKYYQHNPVLEPNKIWETTSIGSCYAMPFSDGVWYDDKENLFKMWYLAGGNYVHKDPNKVILYTCYAESKDGKNWVKPNIGIIDSTNVCETAPRDASTIWLDRNEKDPSKRWKMFNNQATGIPKQWQIVLKYSPDGKHWSKGVAQSGYLNARTTTFYNPFINKWVLSMRGSGPVTDKSRHYLEANTPQQLVSLAHRLTEGINDENIVFWFGPDGMEKRHEKYPNITPGLYNFDANAYESIILGQYVAWSGPENEECARLGIQKRNFITLGYSRDGFHFYRPSHDAFLNVNESKGAWNWGNVQSVGGTPLIVGDSLYFYCSGRRINDKMWDSHSSTGLATLRRDGFVSMQAGNTQGYLITEPIIFNGKFPFVNVDLQQNGYLKVEILDEKGNTIKGYSAEDFITLKETNSTKTKIEWTKHKDLGKLTNKVVRFKFLLKNGDLYAFWVSKWSSGESGGYTAGGGPGLNASGIDIK